MNNEKKFIKLTPFKMQVLQSFPFIDEDFDAITNYELLCKVVEYLNKTVDNVDLLNEKVTEFENYFDNLDVQDEINKKLDIMAEDGTLSKIINDELLTDINRQIESINEELSQVEQNVDEKIENIDNKKVDKNGIEEIQYQNLSQEIKEMFTGGNTPVVGENSVSTSNIVDHSVTPIKLSDSVLSNLINMEKLTRGGYYYNNELYPSNDYVNIKVEIKPNTEYLCDHLRFGDYFNENDVFISGVSINNQTAGNYRFTTPSNAKYLKISWNITNFPTNRLQENLGFALFEVGDYKLLENVDINLLKNIVVNTFNGYVQNLHLIDGYYIESDGLLAVNKNLMTTPFIKINKEDTMYFSRARVVAWYNENLKLVQFDNNSGYDELVINVPENAMYFRASYSKSYFDNEKIYSLSYINFLNEKLQDNVFKELYYNASGNSVLSNNLLEVTRNIDNKKNCSYTGYCEFTTFDTLYIGHGENDYSGGYLKIDNTNIYIYMRKGADTATVLYDTIPHGLTITDYLNIDIKQAKDSSNIDITLTTSTGQFKVNNKLFIACNGKIYLKPSGMNITNAKMNYVLNDLNQKIYLFGDSYIGIDSDDRYPYYLMQNSYTNILLSGYPGEGSSNALICLNKLISKKLPSILIWTLGMNDGDTSVINSYWKQAVDTLITLCERNNITLILATIPNTPTVKNTLKNEYVKSTGLRYIDFAKCVGAESENSTWYSGCLSSDNVHPTSLGAKLLYAEFLKAVPEVIQEN